MEKKSSWEEKKRKKKKLTLTMLVRENYNCSNHAILPSVQSLLCKQPWLSLSVCKYLNRFLKYF